MVSRSKVCAGVMLALHVAGGLSCSPERTERSRPNVLLISLDSTRRDLLSCYGRRPVHAPERPTSPNLDRLAREGVLMRDAYANSSWTLVSHLSLLTGLTPLAHGVDDVYQSYAGPAPLLAEVLQGAGYRTAGFYSGPLLEPHHGFGRGFERYEACYGAELAASAQRELELRQWRDATEDPTAFESASAAHRQARVTMMNLSHADVSSRAVTDAVLNELDDSEDDERPFFVFAHYFDPHFDYVPPAKYDVFDEDYSGAIDGRNFLFNPAIAGPKKGVQSRERIASNRDMEHIQALYEGELAWTDAELGRVLDKLEALGRLDETLIVVVSDHGDEFFEHGSIGHRRTLYEEVVQVPWIMRLPERLPSGVEVAGLVSLVDVPATILELVGLEPPAEGQGRSVLPEVRGEAVADGRERSVQYRVVQSHPVKLQIDGYGEASGTQFFVTDAFRRGSIKIYRTTRWARPDSSDHELPQAELDASAAAQRLHESLIWVDLDQDQGEGLGSFSVDFTAAEVRSVLDAFRAAYAEIEPQRIAGVVSEGRQRFTAMLRGLGYVEGDETEQATDGRTQEDFMLPLPGHRLVDEETR